MVRPSLEFKSNEIAFPLCMCALAPAFRSMCQEGEKAKGVTVPWGETIPEAWCIAKALGGWSTSNASN